MTTDTFFKFSDKTVPYDTFIKDFSIEVGLILNTLMRHKPMMSQNEAWREFKKSRVQRWVKEKKVEPVKDGQYILYPYAVLYKLSKQQ